MAPERLSALPQEVFDAVQDWLELDDVRALSQTCKSLYVRTSRARWQSATIRPLHRLSPLHHLPSPPPELLKHTLRLRFLSNRLRFTRLRCPHARVPETTAAASLDGGDDVYATEESKEERSAVDSGEADWRFKHLTWRVKEVLSRLKPNQLLSFGWHFGACLSDEILGPDGLLSQQQQSLRSLSLMTDYCCDTPDRDNCHIDLSSFDKLEHLEWRAPRAGDLNSIFEAVAANMQHLESLVLDFGDPGLLERTVQMRDVNTIDIHNLFTSCISNLSFLEAGMLFPNLQVLSLTGIPLTREAGESLDITKLQSLILRKCQGWELFLGGSIRPHSPFRMSSLEVQHPDEPPRGHEESFLCYFLPFLDNLDELYFGTVMCGNTKNLLDILYRRQTLRHLVVNRRRVRRTGGLGSGWDGWDGWDETDVGLGRTAFKAYERSPQWHPLDGFRLESLGMCALPKYMKSIMRPLQFTNTLKLVHIRHSSKDYNRWGSWAVDELDNPKWSWAGDELWESASDSGEEDLLSGYEVRLPKPGGVCNCAMEPLTKDFRLLADWAFGPDGVSTLEMIAYGDFSYGGRELKQNVVLRRDAGEERGYEILQCHHKVRSCRQLAPYRNMLESCPVEELFPGADCGS